MTHSVAITGMGLVTAQGIGVAPTWQGVIAGREALQSWSAIPDPPLPPSLNHIKVAQCPANLPNPDDLPPRLWLKLSRTQQLACLAADEAITQAGFHRRMGAQISRPIGLFLATTVGGMDITEEFYAQYRLNRESADYNLLRRLQPQELGALLTRRHRIGGPGLTQVCLTTCVGSALAIGAAMDAINLGECDLALAGGSEALCRVVLSGFHSLKVVAEEGCRPFDKNRPGITVGEGAGILVLEKLEHAQQRGAKPLAYVRGFGATCDAYHITAPEPEGKQAARAMREALARAGLKPQDVDYINAHGTGTRDNDAMEAKAILSVFGHNGTALPPVSSTKRCTGHTFGAAGVIEAILCVCAIRKGMVPRNAGSVEADPTLEIPVARGESLRREVRAAMSTNFAFGGNNTAILLAREVGGEL